MNALSAKSTGTVIVNIRYGLTFPRILGSFCRWDVVVFVAVAVAIVARLCVFTGPVQRQHFSFFYGEN